MLFLFISPYAPASFHQMSQQTVCSFSSLLSGTFSVYLKKFLKNCYYYGEIIIKTCCYGKSLVLFLLLRDHFEIILVPHMFFTGHLETLTM